MNLAEIERRIPHRSPMLLIDQIVSSDDKSIVCRKTFRDDEFFVQGHFPGQPIVPGVIQCECCLQAGALMLAGKQSGMLAGKQSGMLAGKQSGDAALLPVATRMDAVKFKRMVRPGDTVEIQVTLNQQLSNAFFMTGKMLLDGKLTTRLDFACSLTRPQNAGAA